MKKFNDRINPEEFIFDTYNVSNFGGETCLYKFSPQHFSVVIFIGITINIKYMGFSDFRGDQTLAQFLFNCIFETYK